MPELFSSESPDECLLFLQEILESSIEHSIFGEDSDGTIVLWSEGSRRSFGYHGDEVVGKANSLLLYPSDEGIALAYRKMRDDARIKGKWEGTADCLRKDGSRFQAHVVMTPRIGPTGDPTGFLSILRDIGDESPFHRHEREARNEAKMLRKELEDFSYSVSHDLRAPLRHINGFVDLIEETAGSGLDPKCRRYLGAVAGAAKRMNQLIDDLLVFSRVGRAKMTPVDVELSEVARETVAKLRPAIGDREIRWKISSLPVVRADPALMRTVFTELLGNAVKYTRGRSPAEIEVGAIEEEEKAVVLIRDNGVGFDMEYAGKLFGVFQRLHRADDFEGTGIGLAKVKRIVSRQGGAVWATGKLNEGATFYFSLPQRGARTPEEEDAAEVL